ncbi:hypothetical protein K3495_g5677 [Podosphaera aphanis]|nr:hypothetical protein K3495_g5677 [Podosphaera aphanis]
MFKDKPKEFWMSTRMEAPHLSQLALELFHTTANSVALERAFSTMNLLLSKLRNRISVETMDKLCFIYINVRSLRQSSDWDQWECSTTGSPHKGRFA